MTKRIAVGLAVFAFLTPAWGAQAQDAAPSKQEEQPAAKSDVKTKKAPATAQKLNLQEYIRCVFLDFCQNWFGGIQLRGDARLVLCVLGARRTWKQDIHEQ